MSNDNTEAISFNVNVQTLGKVQALLKQVCLRYELVSISDDKPIIMGKGVNELACGSQAFIATLLFDPSMSALPIIPKQNSVSVGLFTH